MFHSEKPPPSRLEGEGFVLMPLTTDQTERDFHAVVETRQTLRLRSGTDWPSDNFDLEENHETLAAHHREHEAGDAYTYTVESPDGSTCLGCVYLRPMAWIKDANPEELAAVSDDAVVVAFWVRTSRVASGLERRLFEALKAWLSDAWNFPEVVFQARDIASDLVEMYEAAGLTVRYRVVCPPRQGNYLLYG